MDEITVRFIDKTPEDGIRASILIEGLPGIGHVGKLVAEHMIRELGAEKIAEIESIFFPPQVIIDEQGTVRLANNEIYFYESEHHRFLFLVGDYQATSAEGHYLLADAYLDIAEACGVERLYTLGGAINQPGLKDVVEAAGAIVGRDEPGGGIVGAAGLLLGLGLTRGIEGICLMGETSGYLVDPRSAASLLKVLSGLLEIEIDPTLLEQRAEEMEFMLQKLIDGDRISQDDELRYFV
jgi:uncharacterized protein (TIGR00162 family)